MSDSTRHSLYLFSLETNFGSQSVAAMTLGLDDGRIDADLDKLRCTTLSAVDYITEPITYQQFFHQYLVPNRPCVFGPAFTCGWGSCIDWVTEDGKPNLEFLLKQFGMKYIFFYYMRVSHSLLHLSIYYLVLFLQTT